MTAARPFLRWAGGKTKLLPELLARAPKRFGTYFEPFIGGGAMFFALRQGGAGAVLSDINTPLISTYRAIRDNVHVVIRFLRDFESKDKNLGASENYYRVRSLGFEKYDYFLTAARMIYLNKRCFNGLFRVNSKGIFNVAVGKFKVPPTICDEENLRACSDALQDAGFGVRDFEASVSGAKCGDFVYFDPPYVPLTETANFTQYSKEGFGPEDQRRLASLARGLKDRGVHVMISNAGTPEVAELYRDFKIEEVQARRSINCKSSARGPVTEYIIT